MSYTVADDRSKFKQSPGPRTGRMEPIFGPTLDEIAESGNPVALFVRTCRNIGLRREKEGRKHWSREEWAAWARRGRAAFGSSPKALYGDLSLIETMLETGLDAETIASELARMRANREADDRRRELEQAQNREREKQRDEDLEVEAAVRKEMIRLRAKALAEDRREQAGIATPRVARRRLQSLGTQP